MKALVIALAIWLGVVLAYNALQPKSASGPATRPYPTDTSAAARAACRQFLEARLNDPGRTEWGDSWDWPTSTEPNGVFTVLMKIRTPNTAGGLQRMAYRCRVVNIGGDNWRLNSLLREST